MYVYIYILYICIFDRMQGWNDMIWSNTEWYLGLQFHGRIAVGPLVRWCRDIHGHPSSTHPLCCLRCFLRINFDLSVFFTSFYFKDFEGTESFFFLVSELLPGTRDGQAYLHSFQDSLGAESSGFLSVIFVVAPWLGVLLPPLKAMVPNHGLILGYDISQSKMTPNSERVLGSWPEVDGCDLPPGVLATSQ